MNEYYKKIYNNINKILENIINDDIKLQQLDDAYTLAKIIYENTPSNSFKQHFFVDLLDLNTSIDISYNFFKTINPMFANQFLNILEYEIIDNKQAVKFNRIHKAGNIIFDFSGVSDDGLVYIDYDNTIMDICRMVHEFTHKFSVQNNIESFISSNLSEIPTISMEGLLVEFLLGNTAYNKNDIKYIGVKRIENTFNDSSSIIFEHILLELFQENKYINEEIVSKKLKQFCKYSNNYSCTINDRNDFLRAINDNNDFTFKQRLRYIIGTLLGFYISESNNHIDILNTLINILGNSDSKYNIDIKRLNEIKLPCIKDGSIYLINKNDELNNLTNLYKQKIKTFIK